MLSPLLLNICFAAVIIVVLQRFRVIVSDLVYLDDAPKGEDGRPEEDGTLEMIRRAVCEMLYVDDAAVVSTSSRGLAKMMDVVIVIACQVFGLTVSEKKSGSFTCCPIPAQCQTRCELRRQANGINRQSILCTMVGLSSRARTSTPRLSIASAPVGRASKYIVPTCTTDGTLGCRSGSGYSKRRWWKLCCTDAPRGLCALRT